MSASSARTILVTGAAGFIGSSTAIRLLERGDHVVGLDTPNRAEALPQRRRLTAGRRATPSLALRKT
jgi:nucleoside-diphosphate-sugar epimerase